jgi:hypothetical protein
VGRCIQVAVTGIDFIRVAWEVGAVRRVGFVARPQEVGTIPRSRVGWQANPIARFARVGARSACIGIVLVTGVGIVERVPVPLVRVGAGIPVHVLVAARQGDKQNCQHGSDVQDGPDRRPERITAHPNPGINSMRSLRRSPSARPTAYVRRIAGGGVLVARTHAADDTAAPTCLEPDS